MKVLEEFLKPTQKGLFKMLRKMYGDNAYVSVLVKRNCNNEC